MIAKDIFKQKRGFSLVEVMFLFVVLSLVMAAAVPLVTRKHESVPLKEFPHGTYRCIAQTNPESGEVSYIEELYTPMRRVYQTNTDRCTFNVPSAASYKIDLYGAGAGGVQYASVSYPADRTNDLAAKYDILNNGSDDLVVIDDAELNRLATGAYRDFITIDNVQVASNGSDDLAHSIDNLPIPNDSDLMELYNNALISYYTGGGAAGRGFNALFDGTAVKNQKCEDEYANEVLRGMGSLGSSPNFSCGGFFRNESFYKNLWPEGENPTSVDERKKRFLYDNFGFYNYDEFVKTFVNGGSDETAEFETPNDLKKICVIYNSHLNPAYAHLSPVDTANAYYNGEIPETTTRTSLVGEGLDDKKYNLHYSALYGEYNHTEPVAEVKDTDGNVTTAAVPGKYEYTGKFYGNIIKSSLYKNKMFGVADPEGETILADLLGFWTNNYADDFEYYAQNSDLPEATYDLSEFINLTSKDRLGYEYPLVSIGTIASTVGADTTEHPTVYKMSSGGKNGFIYLVYQITEMNFRTRKNQFEATHPHTNISFKQYLKWLSTGSERRIQAIRRPVDENYTSGSFSTDDCTLNGSCFKLPDYNHRYPAVITASYFKDRHASEEIGADGIELCGGNSANASETFEETIGNYSSSFSFTATAKDSCGGNADSMRKGPDQEFYADIMAFDERNAGLNIFKKKATGGKGVTITVIPNATRSVNDVPIQFGYRYDSWDSGNTSSTRMDETADFTSLIPVVHYINVKTKRLPRYGDNAEYTSYCYGSGNVGTYDPLSSDYFYRSDLNNYSHVSYTPDNMRTALGITSATEYKKCASFKEYGEPSTESVYDITLADSPVITAFAGTRDARGNFRPLTYILSKTRNRYLQVGNAGYAGKHRTLNVSDLGQACEFHISGGGPILRLDDIVGYQDITKGNSVDITNNDLQTLITEYEQDLYTGITCLSETSEIVLDERVDGGHYPKLKYPGIDNADPDSDNADYILSAVQEKIYKVYDAADADYWFIKAPFRQIKNILAESTWLKTITGMQDLLKIGGDSYGVSKGGSGTGIEDHCTALNGTYGMYPLYIIGGTVSFNDTFKLKSQVKNGETNPDEFGGFISGYNCFDGTHKYKFDGNNDASYYVITPAEPGGPGAVVIKW